MGVAKQRISETEHIGEWEARKTHAVHNGFLPEEGREVVEGVCSGGPGAR
jgi:hypothetical protein